jgi:hypothetical protein
MTTVMCKQCSPPRSFPDPEALASHIRGEHKPDGLEWEDPPPKYLGKAAQAVLAAVALFPQLRRNPGRWARICEFKTQSTAFGQVKKLRESHPDIQFEARGRETGSAIWARYVEEG